MGNKCSIQSPIKPLKQCAITSSALVALTLHNCQHLESFKMHCDELFDHGIKTAPMHIHAFDLNTFVHGFKGRGREGGWYSPTPKKINLKISHCKIIKNRHRTHSLANKIISRNPPPPCEKCLDPSMILIYWKKWLLVEPHRSPEPSRQTCMHLWPTSSPPTVIVTCLTRTHIFQYFKLSCIRLYSQGLFILRISVKIDFLRDPLEFVLILRNIVLFSSE